MLWSQLRGLAGDVPKQHNYMFLFWFAYAVNTNIRRKAIKVDSLKEWHLCKAFNQLKRSVKGLVSVVENRSVLTSIQTGAELVWLENQWSILIQSLALRNYLSNSQKIDSCNFCDALYLHFIKQKAHLSALWMGFNYRIDNETLEYSALSKGNKTRMGIRFDAVFGSKIAT